MGYKSKSLKEYLDDLAAKKPAPGGGSAAALTGALSCALLTMVCNFTLGKDKYKDIEPNIENILKQTESLRRRFLELVDLDVEAYYKVYNSRKGNSKIYQRNLIKATTVPLEMCKLSVCAFKFYPFLAKRANKYLVSDCIVAKELLKSCFKSAETNVIINLLQIEDRKFILKTKKTIAKLKSFLRQT